MIEVLPVILIWFHPAAEPVRINHTDPRRFGGFHGDGNGTLRQEFLNEVIAAIELQSQIPLRLHLVSTEDIYAALQLRTFVSALADHKAEIILRSAFQHGFSRLLQLLHMISLVRLDCADCKALLFSPCVPYPFTVAAAPYIQADTIDAVDSIPGQNQIFAFFQEGRRVQRQPGQRTVWRSDVHRDGTYWHPIRTVFIADFRFIDSGTRVVLTPGFGHDTAISLVPGVRISVF